MTYALTDKSDAAIQARYQVACQAIGKEDPSLAITDSHADVETLLADRRDLVAALKAARAALNDLPSARRYCGTLAGIDAALAKAGG